MVAYLDSSTLLRHFLLGDEGIRQALECDSVISSELLEIECKRVFYRYKLQGDLDDSGFLEADGRLESVLSGVLLLLLSSGIKKRSAEAFPVLVGALDALHLSSALTYQAARSDATLLFFSYGHLEKLQPRTVYIRKTPMVFRLAIDRIHQCRSS